MLSRNRFLNIELVEGQSEPAIISEEDLSGKSFKWISGKSSLIA